MNSSESLGFKAPGFSLRRVDKDRDASDISKVFKQSKLDGKQVWVLTAPSSVPITLLEQVNVPMNESKRDVPLLSHDGARHSTIVPRSSLTGCRNGA